MIAAAADARSSDLIGRPERVVEILFSHQGQSVSYKDMRNFLGQNAFDLCNTMKASRAVRVLTHSDTDRAIQEAQEQEGGATSEAPGAPHPLAARAQRFTARDVPNLILACSYLLHGTEDDAASAVERILKEHPGSLSREYGGLCALHVAAEEGRPRLVERLLEAQASVNQPDRDGRSPLLLAAQSGHADVVDILLHSDAQLTFERNGLNLLARAAMFGHEEVGRRLLDAASQRDDSDRCVAELLQGGTKTFSTLAIAARYGHTQMCELLLARGVNVGAEVSNPLWTSLHRACANGHMLTARAVLRAEGRLLNHPDPSGFTPLMAACAAGHHDIVLMLVEEYDAEVGAVNTDGETALWLAASCGHADVVDFLARHKQRAGLDRCASAKHDEKHNHTRPQMTALTVASAHGHPLVVRTLLTARADVHSTSGAEDALICATRAGHMSIVRALIAHKAVDRLPEALAIAEERLSHAEAGSAVADVCERIQELLRRPRRAHQRAAMARARSFHVAEELDSGLLDGADIGDIVRRLAFHKQEAFSGQIVPSRPSPAQLAARETPLGPLETDSGVVLQLGPFGSVWLRVGCVPHVPWLKMWLRLKKYVAALLDAKRAKVAGGDLKPGAVYVVVSLRAMQSIDFSWLFTQGFRFHHYRDPGHGDTAPPAPAAEGAPASAHLGTAEFVYYCWPGPPETDLIPR